MTLQEAKSIARHLGLTLRKVRSGDYRVNFRDGNETTAYCADNLEDAVKTAVEMAGTRDVMQAVDEAVCCTMKGYRALGGSASLSAVCRHIKLARSGDLHGAIEDAWLAMQIYLWLHGRPLQDRLCGSLPRTPSNFRHAEIGP